MISALLFIANFPSIGANTVNLPCSFIRVHFFQTHFRLKFAVKHVTHAQSMLNAMQHKFSLFNSTSKLQSKNI